MQRHVARLRQGQGRPRDIRVCCTVSIYIYSIYLFISLATCRPAPARPRSPQRYSGVFYCIYISISRSMYLQPSQRFHFEGFKDMSPGSGKAKVAPAIFGCVALYLFISLCISNSHRVSTLKGSKTCRPALGRPRLPPRYSGVFHCIHIYISRSISM